MADMATEFLAPSDRLLRMWSFIREEVPFEHGLLMFRDGRGRDVFRLAYGLDGDGEAERCLRIVGRVLEDRQPVCVARLPVEHFLRDDGRVGFHETGSVLCMPLAVCGRVAGALYLDRAPRADPFSQDELGFLWSLTGPIVCVLAPAITQGEFAVDGASPGTADDFCREIIGRSEAIVRLRGLIRKVRDTDAAVFITGESGTGKELVARAIHQSGPRRSGPFVAVNSSAIPDALLESELFGHVRGAFTGAVRDKPGLLEEAQGGTFFFDEVGDLSPQLQAKLLRVIQEKEVRRVGANQGRRVEVRFVSATNKPIEDEVRRGRFREDLFYRLGLIPVHIPPLRDRRDDLPPLVDHFLEADCREMNRERAFFSTDAWDMIYSYDWPGNVRELQNEIKRSLIFMDRNSRLIPAECLSEAINPRRQAGPASPVNYFEARAKFEKGFLLRVLALHEFNRSRTAAKIGLSRQGLFKLLKKHKIDANQDRLRRNESNPMDWPACGQGTAP